ncbi:synaptotagmin-14 [Musca vetustissima]|uniref:synaptotagmin-14 n=1 Tax=Musca vetustissima TaxID=27455 RepID=UPI002AB7DCFF|nr:synaptotagmin-14 [Musca vetustissima]
MGTVEITTVLSAVFGVVALMLLFFLYVNRKWCFHARRGLHCCDEKHLASKCVQKLSRKRRYDNTSSDSEEDILRRLRLQQARIASSGSGSGSFTNYGINQLNPLSQNFNYFNSDLQRVTVTPRDSSKDPLAIAERGKVGIPSSHSECSSNDSVEASIDSHTGILSGEKKERHASISKTSDISQSASLKESRIDLNAEPIKTTKYHKLTTTATSSNATTPPRQDSIEEVPNIPTCNNNTQITNSNNTTTTSNNNNTNNNNEDEPLFDTSDLRSIKSDDISLQTQCYGKSGSIEISLLYDAPMRKMTVHVLQARGLPTLGNGQQCHTQVRLLMLPNKKQKHKTKIRSGENPQYMESFLLHRVTPEEVNNMGLRVRLYGCERLRKERLIGEAYVSFATIDLELETNLWLPLEPRNTSSILGSSSDLLSLARSDSAGSTTSMQHGGVPELLLGLGYNGTTGRLTVEIVKGSQFRTLSINKAPDTYVKLCLVSSIGQEISRAKTSTRRGQPNPLFKETFVFQVALFQLNDVTLMVSVYAKRNMKKNEMVGWFSLGLNSSGPEEVAHWVDMRDMAKGELLARWHVLVDS